MKKVVRDFECAMCGGCCASQDLVQLTAYELYRLAEYLKVEPAAFFGKYCTVTATNLNPALHLYIKTENGRCPFLNDNKCSVHEARPYACKAYPMRVYWSLTEDMKEFVRSKYDLEEACSLFKLDDGDVLLGDYELLARQAIAYWTDEAYFGMAGAEADLSVPYRVADFFMHDKEMTNIAKRHAVNPDHPPTVLDVERAYAKISLTLQAAMWNATSAVVDVSKVEIGEDERIGKYLLATADGESAKALRMLVECGRMDLARTFIIGSKAREGYYHIAAIHASSVDHVAIGFILEADKATLDELTGNGEKPLYAFFQAEDSGDGKLAGFRLNVKI